jgi:hypothetical protein
MTLKELLNISINHLKDLTSVTNPDFRLEQAEFIQSEDLWEVIVSYLVENTNKKTNPLAPFSADFQYHRMYKKLRIDNSSKEIVGFYIYNS